MLSDEEEVIEWLKRLVKINKRDNLDNTFTEILLNLIKKQSKEIEELKNITKSYDSFLGDEKIVIADKKFFVNGYFQENFVRKDKIKAKIEELDREIKFEQNEKVIIWLYKQKRVLQSLLEKE